MYGEFEALKQQLEDERTDWELKMKKNTHVRYILSIVSEAIKNNSASRALKVKDYLASTLIGEEECETKSWLRQSKAVNFVEIRFIQPSLISWSK